MSVDTEQLSKIEEKQWYKLLHNKLPEELLLLQGPQGSFYLDQVEDKNIRYLSKHIVQHAWGNQLAFGVMCVTARNLTPQSIMNITSSLNARIRDLFDCFQLSSFEELLPSHIEQYVTGQVIKDHSDRQRQGFITFYNTFYFNMQKWFKTQFTDEQQQSLAKYMLPQLPFDNRDFNARTKAISSAKTKRKEDTSAITPLLPEIRAEGHLRWNQINRLRETYREALKRVISEGLTLPIEFSYEESEYANERWYFKLWDYTSFDFEAFDANVRSSVVDDEECFVEFIRAENLDDGSDGDGPWFLDILKKRLLGNWEANHTKVKDRAEILKYLKQWGYDEEDTSATIAPFASRNLGILTQGFHITRRQRLSDKLLINVEPIFIACMFARFALDIITSSGARINEVLQISYDKNCCVVAADKGVNSQQTSYILRLIPKGREDPENFYVPEEIFKFMTIIVKVLKESYNSDQLPEVNFEVNSRKHLMEARRYVFQYQSKHIHVHTINSILRFLLHGIVIQSADGSQVIVRAHLLRHAFATHAVQTEKLPVDIVKTLLHQKDIEVTNYYSQPTSKQISDSVHGLHENWASYIDIQKGILRSPSELKEIYEDYSEKVGTLSKVVGGICTIDSVCPTKMACVGCAAKVPRPEFKEEIAAYYRWADESEKRFEALGLTLEARKMKISKNRARNEIKEIELVEKYQKDEQFHAELRFGKEQSK